MHDAANILRRYFNQLPEPIIPLEFYERFRDPLKNHQEQAVGALEAQSPSVGDFDQDAAIRKYQRLITELPPLNRQLLLYILDLLAVFDSKSDLNKMTTANLAAIFQPGILSHPQHDMAPQEYRLSQDVLIFLIENQDNFLIGMHGTGFDPDTIRDVQSGAPSPSKGSGSPTTPGRAKTVVARSSSNASAGAESIRKWGSLRRNASVSSSKHSKRSDGAPVPVGSPATPAGASGVNRSNTVPSRRGGSNNSAQSSPRFSRDKQSSDTPTPTSGLVPAAAVINSTDLNKAREGSLQSTPVATVTPQFPPPNMRGPEVISPSDSESTTPLANVPSHPSPATTYHTPKKEDTPLLAPSNAGVEYMERPGLRTPSGSSGRGFLDMFKQSPTGDLEGQRKPNKLQKRRIPGTSLSSAQSSNNDLNEEAQQEERSSVTPTGPAAVAPAAATHTDTLATTTQPNDPTTPNRESTGGTLRAASPAGSYHSATEDTDDADFAGDDLSREQALEAPDKTKHKRRWRFSRSQNKPDPVSPPRSEALGSGNGGYKELTTSRSTIGSSGAAPPRRSFQDTATETSFGPATTTSTSTMPSTPTPATTLTDRSATGTSDAVFSDSERERRAGPMSWIRGKIHTHKDKDVERRAVRPGMQASDRQPSRENALTGVAPEIAPVPAPPTATHMVSPTSGPVHAPGAAPANASVPAPAPMTVPASAHVPTTAPTSAHVPTTVPAPAHVSTTQPASAPAPVEAESTTAHMPTPAPAPAPEPTPAIATTTQAETAKPSAESSVPGTPTVIRSDTDQSIEERFVQAEETIKAAGP